MRWLLILVQALLAGCAAGGATPSPSTRPTGSPAAGLTVNVAVPTFKVGAVVEATVFNGTEKAIYADDFKTDCSIAHLQRQEAGTWADITGCSLGRPTMTLTIEPGGSRTVRFDPSSFHLATSGGLGFVAGTYRVRFTYRLDREGPGEPFEALSVVFTVT